jgi:hypothetical protein
VCVNYSAILAITLPRNMRHMSECLVVTSPDDHATQDIACGVPGVSVFETTAFHDFGAKFNKGYALELGFEKLGRHGWIAIWDADCMFPDEMPLHLLKPGHLNGCRRRILDDPSLWSPDLDWRRYPLSRDGGPIGFFQAFRADDPVLIDRPFWYEVTFTHCGGGDAYFIKHWDSARLIVHPFDVLHLGKTDMNWFGTSQESRDMMARFVRENGWRGASRKHTEESARRAPEIIERVDVPGYTRTDYELPFVRRTKRMRDQ